MTIEGKPPNVAARLTIDDLSEPPTRANNYFVEHCGFMP
jgi:hypothetical protein